MSESCEVVVSTRLQHSVPVTTPPCATQLEPVPVRAKFLRVAFLPLLLASVNIVSEGLAAFALPWLKL